MLPFIPEPCVIIGTIESRIMEACETKTFKIKQFGQGPNTPSEVNLKWSYKKADSSKITVTTIVHEYTPGPTILKRSSVEKLTFSAAEKQLHNYYQLGCNALNKHNLDLATRYFEIAHKGSNFLFQITPHEINPQLFIIQKDSKIGIACQKLEELKNKTQSLTITEKQNTIYFYALSFIRFVNKHFATNDKQDIKNQLNQLAQGYVDLIKEHFTPTIYSPQIEALENRLVELIEKNRRVRL